MCDMIERNRLKKRVESALRRAPVVVILGPRQCGKTTLAREFLSVRSANYFDLEDPVSLSRLTEPMTALKSLRRLVVIDEIQRCPELFPILRVLSDLRSETGRYLILGSASPHLLRQSSESLAGRMEVIEMSGFSIEEVGEKKRDLQWLRGGFPRSFLAKNAEASRMWRKSFIQALVERDLPQFGVSLPGLTLQRFWKMLAHSQGQIWSAADPARSLGLSETTIRRYLDLFSGLYLIRTLQPWRENLKKRQIKSPKIYFHDSGLLHELLGLHSIEDLLSHPKCGASWEGWLIEEIARFFNPDEMYFWATHNGAELDLLLFRAGKRYGFEIKRSDAPKLSPSMKIALEDLGLDRLFVLYPGNISYALTTKVKVIPIRSLFQKNFFQKNEGGTMPGV